MKEISQNIFNQWFINFEFLNDQGQPYRLNDGEMIESELGLIPKNWSTGTINDIGSVVGGGTPSKNMMNTILLMVLVGLLLRICH